MHFATFHHHVYKQHSGAHEVPHDKLELIATGLGIRLCDLEEAAIRAAHYKVVIREFGLARIILAWSEGRPDDRLRREIERAERVIEDLKHDT